ncbi:MAG: hypothetical protein E6J40_02870 [Chloroflexi bacterium]|nr:MAG: hypothetical protein E6J40_02870 [Chloroflexota bacterium]
MTIDSTTLTQAPVAGPTPEPILRTARIVRLPRSPKVIAGLVILAVFGVVAIIGRWISPYSPNQTDPQNWVQHVLVPPTTTRCPFLRPRPTGLAPRCSRKTCCRRSWPRRRPRSSSASWPPRSQPASRFSSVSAPAISAGAPTRSCRSSPMSFWPYRAYRF